MVMHEFIATDPSMVVAYRAGVERLALDVASRDRSDIDTTLVDGLADGPVASVLVARRGQGDHEHFVNSLIADVIDFTPTGLSSATDRSSLLKVRLLAELDSLWWDSAEPYETDAAVIGDSSLVNLRAARARGDLRFDFRSQVFDLPRRLMRAADKRLFPKRSPRTIGMRLPYGRPEMIAVLNSIADEVSAQASDAPRLWVNSIVRSIEYQDEMRGSGYTAATGSAHCVGWAADIEMAFMHAQGFGDVLSAVLYGRAETGMVNVIDEGQAWHICLNPTAVETGVV